MHAGPAAVGPLEPRMNTMNVPPYVLARPPGTLLVQPAPGQTIFYVREDDFGLRKYPRNCDVEFLFGVFWETRKVCVVALLLRLAKNDNATFEHWINPADPAGVRLLLNLTKHRHLDVLVAADSQVRALRAPNRLAGLANELLAYIRERRDWSAEEFETERVRINTLFPTPFALWRHCRSAKLPLKSVQE